MKDYASKIAQELKLKETAVTKTIGLFEEGSTVPFIARYRKEITGNLDEVVITSIRDRLEQLKELDIRREAILKSIHEQGKLTPELKTKIEAAVTMAILEDLYLPYKPKKRTRATIAKEKGLEPLAKLLFEQSGINPQEEAKRFINKEKGIEDAEQALAGARDIMAEWISENAEAREKLRQLFRATAHLTTEVFTGKEEEGSKYKDYFHLNELASTTPSHRMLAVRRAAQEGIIRMKIQPEEQKAADILIQQFVLTKKPDAKEVEQAAVDAYKRLIASSLEVEYRLELKKKADEKAIKIFKDNLEQLLMAPPMGQKMVMSIDPGMRTGSKVVCLDRQGKLLKDEVIYLFSSDDKKEEGATLIKALVKKYKIEVIAVGNGTGGRETETYLKNIGLPKEIVIVLVEETGASIYSASEVAREEFSDKDLTVRGAVSIGRRLMDPLSELVKIDPKSIGVGQYQHDVDQKLLKASLDDTVISCVNRVGVEVNTASKQILMYVSGLGPKLAQEFIRYRETHGLFRSRQDFLSIAGLGPKVFEQAAGFLRINDAPNPLDRSAVHPERYDLVKNIAVDLNETVEHLMKDEKLRKHIKLEKYVTKDVGMPTLKDIMAELEKPARDPREPFQLFTYNEKVHSLEDLVEGMELDGVITNITAFGAFVDIGVHHHGLIHISEMADRFIKDPHEAVKLQEKVKVRVLRVDLERKRIELSLRKGERSNVKPTQKPFKFNKEEHTYTPFKDLL